MSIKSIEVNNVLSFDSLKIDSVKDINCLVGKNNVGKSNLFKLVRFFYGKIEGRRELSPELNSNYSAVGFIRIVFDTDRIFRIVTSQKNTNKKFFRHIANVLFSAEAEERITGRKVGSSSIPRGWILSAARKSERGWYSDYPITLNIKSDGTSEWDVKDRNVLKIINYLFPYLGVDARRLELHEWKIIWDLISRLKSFDVNKINNKNVLDFFDKQFGEQSKSYSSFISTINAAISTKKYSYREEVLSYIKAGLEGHSFVVNGQDLDMQSDGTNAYFFLDTLVTLMVALTRKEYISPFLFVDEPELGLHPKRCEALIINLSETFHKYRVGKGGKSIKKPFPNFFFFTHSPNLVKEVIKRFQENHQVLHVSKRESKTSRVVRLDSRYNKNNFLATFSDNEARLFFSDFILFVEGQTELEAFGNVKLRRQFEYLDNVDIYQNSSNTSNESINPSSTNAAIPYLFLFDADKAYSVTYLSTDEVKVDLKNNGALIELHKNKLKKAARYFSRGHSTIFKQQLKNIGYLEFFTNSNNKVNKILLTYEDRTAYNSFNRALQSYLLFNNVKLLSDTFEGCLICLSASELFYRWLKEKCNVNIDNIVKNARAINNEKRLVDFLRIRFNGKSETLLSKKVINKKKNVSGWALRYLSKIEAAFSKASAPSKTDGWVTSFLDFSIEQILAEAKAEKREFKELFKGYFPEFYDIIQRLHPDRYRELPYY